MRGAFALALLVACKAGGAAPLDGATGDGPLDVAPATPDAAPDASPAGCPHRTAAPGRPDHTYAPGEVHVGDVTAASPTDLAALAGIKVISGDLTITDPAADIALPELEVVGGNLALHTDSLSSIHLARLETVGGRFESYRAVGHDPLDVAVLPRFESAGDEVDLQVHDLQSPCLAEAYTLVLGGVTTDPLVLPALAKVSDAQITTTATHVDLPALAGGAVSLHGAQHLVSLHVGAPDALAVEPALELTSLSTSSTGAMSLSIDTAPKLADLAGLSTVTAFHSISLLYAGALVDLSAIANASVDGDLVLWDTGLTTIRFPNMTALSGQLSLVNNNSLTTLDLPHLASIGPYDSKIVSNPMLPTCQATAIEQHTTIPPGGTFEIDNDGAGTCP